VEVQDLKKDPAKDVGMLIIQITGGKMPTYAQERKKQENKDDSRNYEDYEFGKLRDKKQKKLKKWFGDEE